MIRVVLVGGDAADWRTYRQAQWIGEVRRRPEAANRPRRHFDIEEDAYKTLLDEWDRLGAGSGPGPALAALARHGSIEVQGP